MNEPRLPGEAPAVDASYKHERFGIGAADGRPIELSVRTQSPLAARVRIVA